MYYYECSGGSFRLVYFIPPDRLRQLREEDRISRQALEDFPDGVDLDCTEPDFHEFEELYGYRPPMAPEALQRAFFAIFSATREWERFQGSGMIPSADLERRVETVDRALRDQEVLPERIEAPPEPPTLAERRQRMDRRGTRQARLYEALEQMPVEGVDPGQTLGQQKFSPISMEEGEDAEKVFAELHQRQRS
ncbi:MAG: hypothetical protein ACYS0D_10925 [Planctomycetota bacterium]